ncbi:FAD-binding and (Fe-S)-binding domain-containing protein [Bowmanella dokdonensis]|uniref:D-lactate dehydrogenase (cytochrome) n=1 Tax=Bowmanella dokdonensis TaxID=751969 RepID=A0A939DMI6_9ALTE|nr:FAD-binding and (Fe-S)-binding domain-containing protein [Bowmanella dokdonensis]MBN7825324.1 FAD-binding oxidoreductase [Bowmanella dokdonensis]
MLKPDQVQTVPVDLHNHNAFKEFVAKLGALLAPGQLMDDLASRLAFAGDASFYHLVPALVVRIENLPQMQSLLRLASAFGVSLTFRAAGTSLSGQAVTDSVLVLLGDEWRNSEIREQGHKIWLQPGVIGAQANRLLKPYGRKLGPDPASIDSCKIGGIAANNASGMCCGVRHNSYHTVAEMQILLADGARLDTADETSVARFRQDKAELLNGLAGLAGKIRNNPVLAERIRHKYRLKNTTGYGINALLDFDDPVEILKHLMIGSEGTLGFIADITYRTVADPACKASGLFIFDDIHPCAEAVSRLASLPVNAVELMDARALGSVADKPAMPVDVRRLSPLAAGLLIEVSGETPQALEDNIARVREGLHLSAGHLLASADFNTDLARNQALWGLRKGMFPAVGAVRAAGTTVIIEDVAFPVAQLADGVAGLQTLFGQYGYDEAIIFGHALEGNLHFVFTQAFDTPSEVSRYGDFMQAVAELVSGGFGGSLKAEHGTGRNMAPFVAMEWGSEAYEVMQRIKDLFDPDNILNPGVIINRDPQVHLKHLKTIPSLDDEIDKCIECGFCEPVCPSRELTLTPRQRIALWRQIQSGQFDAQRQQLLDAYQYQGVDTCAATGLCAERCPVDINTGDFIRQLRSQNAKGQWLAGLSARHYAATGILARFALDSVRVSRNLLGEGRTEKVFDGLHRLSGKRLPRWFPAWPGGARTAKAAKDLGQPVIYFPACPNRIFGADPQAEDQRPLSEVLASVLAKAGYRLLSPHNSEALCCGQPWQSKGHPALAAKKRQEALDALLALAHEQKLPVLVDASPCALQLSDSDHSLKLFETAEFLHQFVLPRLTVLPQSEPVMLHISCSSQRRHSENALLGLARACSEQVVVPNDIQCCGFAGDKGFLTPELNASALKTLKRQIPDDCHLGVSNSRTCEIGLSRHGGIPYQSIVYLLDRVSSAKLA